MTSTTQGLLRGALLACAILVDTAYAQASAVGLCIKEDRITADEALETLQIALALQDKPCELAFEHDPAAIAIANATRNIVRTKDGDSAPPQAEAVKEGEVGAVTADALVLAFRKAVDALEQVPVERSGEVANLREAAVLNARRAIAALKAGDEDHPSLTKGDWSLSLRVDSPLKVVLGKRDNIPSISSASFASCDESNAPGSACRRNFDGALKIGRIIRAIEFYPLSELIRPRLATLAREYRVREVMWDEYFTKTRVQYPWELILNSHFTFTLTPKAPRPPTWQLILLHPDVAVEYVDDAPDGEQFKPTLMAEVLGFNRWGGFEETTGKIKTAYGMSVIATWSDRNDVDDLRWGIMLHLKSRYSMALTGGDGNIGYLLSIALGEKMRTTKEDAEKVEEALKVNDFEAVCDVAGMGFICGK